MRSRLGLCVVVCVLISRVSTACAQDTSADTEPSDLVRLAIGLFGEKDKDIRALGFEQVRTDAPGAAATRAFAAELPKLSTDAQIGLLIRISRSRRRRRAPGCAETAFR
ncbi:MAG: hypothetical protein QM811_04015 [Pirellulales bacterium]